jgi:hypothetical protein
MNVVYSPLLETQLAELKAEYNRDGNIVEPTPVEDGSFVVKVPKVRIPPGWTANEADIWFVVPVQYPSARPDCFWTDESVLLEGGRVPQNTGPNPLPGRPQPVPLRWYSWHVTQWSPIGDTLATYLQVIRRRFADPK